MRKLFWGLLLLMAHFRLGLVGAVLNLLSDSVGACLMLSGIRELNGESPSLERMRSQLIVAAAVLIVRGLNELLGRYIPVVSPALNLALTAFKCYLLYRLTVGVRELERYRETTLHGETLMRCWKVYCGGMVLSVICAFAEIWTVIAAMMLPVCGAAMATAYIVYLVYFYKAGTAYARSAPPVAEILTRENPPAHSNTH